MVTASSWMNHTVIRLISGSRNENIAEIPQNLSSSHRVRRNTPVAQLAKVYENAKTESQQ